MSVSFTLLKANGQRFDLLPGHDDREFSISNTNAAAVLDALGIEDSFSERPWPIPCFRALVIVARRKRLGHASAAIPSRKPRSRTRCSRSIAGGPKATSSKSSQSSPIS